MEAAWASGHCPATGAGWDGFDDGVAVPTPMATSGPIELAPLSVDRIELCRFSHPGDKLTGSAVVASRDTVARFVADLNAVAPSNSASCAGDQSVMLLAGSGSAVLGIDMSSGGCSILTTPAGQADYGRTSLGADIERALDASTR